MTKKKVSQHKTLGDWAALAIQKHFEKFVQHEAAVLEDTDPEDLHQMRVGMRRLRSAVIGFGPVIELPQEAQNQRIGKIARTLGSLRDLDVLTETLQTRYQPYLPPTEQSTLKPALRCLKKQRRQAFKEVRATLHHKRYQRLKQSLATWLEKPIYTPIAQLPIEEVLPDLLMPEISHLFLHPGWMIGIMVKGEKVEVDQTLTAKAVNQLLQLQGPILHDLRKQVKRVRYQMSLFTEFYGETYGEYVEDMKAIQENLGDIQDSEVLEDFLTDIFEQDLKKVIPALGELLINSRYKSWQRWQQLQVRYLTVEHRTNFHLELLKPVIRV